MKTIITELVPNNSRKSFYGKAKVIDTGKVRYLRSYETIVASVGKDGVVRRHTDFKSNTTSRHIAAFVVQAAGKHMTTREFYGLKLEKYRPISVTF